MTLMLWRFGDMVFASAAEPEDKGLNPGWQEYFITA
jgi:hypothetical protein